ncbi:phosphotyrosine-specific ptp2-like protein [Rhodosporidiobolus nylandii]
MAGLPPSFTLSPSSSAFNANFTHLLRGPSTAGSGAMTPLHAPASSPFFTSAPDSSAPPTSTSSMPPPLSFGSSSAAAVPPTPGPGTTAGLEFPSSGAASPFKLPPTLPMAGRKFAGRPAARPSTSPAASVSSQRYTLYNPQTLLTTLLSSLPSDPSATPDSPSLLVLDIRTHTSHLTERLATSLNVCVPSTLLRRPGYGTDRVQESLPPHEQAVFARWPQCSAVIVLDAESTSLADGGGVASLLAKFDRAGYKGKLGWVKGGWYAVRTQLRALPPAEQGKLLESGVSDAEVPSSASASRSGTPLDAPSGSASTLSSSAGAHATPSKKHARPVLQVRDLPIAAFQLASTSAFVNSGGNGSAGQGPLPTTLRGVDHRLTSPSTSGGSSASLASQRPGMGKRQKSGNEFLPPDSGGADGVGGGSGPPRMPHLGMQAGFGVGVPAAMRGGVDPARGVHAGQSTKMSANPFFDNIRQNSESLSLERMLLHLSPVDLPSVPPTILPSLPPYLRSLVLLSPTSRADRLARQFYELEHAERERLEGTFRWHSAQTAAEGSRPSPEDEEAATKEEKRREKEKWAKFGISAGLELGNLNRFKNIFPYEHARVKLHRHSPSATDYVNASFLSLRGSSKRYIASQGPLPTTFRDFWQMCDQEQVGVIIMLTNLQEGGRDKCGRYWVSQKDAEWDVQVEGDLAHEDEARLNLGAGSAGGNFGGRGGAGGGGGPEGGGFFAAFDAARASPNEEKAPLTKQDSTIRRTITVQRHRAAASPAARPRKIRHIQYRAWPDFDIPADPADVVALVNEVDAAQQDYMREIGWRVEEHDGLEPPILAHCSAGVGRTGVFIMVSSLLEKMRKDRASNRAAGENDDDKMDVDPAVPRAPIRPQLRERLSDPETSFLSAGLSLSTLDSPAPRTPTTLVPAATPDATSDPPPTSRAPSAHPAAGSGHPKLPADDGVPALEQPDPAFAGVNELREQRMSMVANYRQYVCVIECVIEGAVKEMQREESA